MDNQIDCAGSGYLVFICGYFVVQGEKVYKARSENLALLFINHQLEPQHRIGLRLQQFGNVSLDFSGRDLVCLL